MMMQSYGPNIGDSVSVDIIKAVADAKGVDPTDIDYVNLDAIEMFATDDDPT